MRIIKEELDFILDSNLDSNDKSISFLLAQISNNLTENQSKFIQKEDNDHVNIIKKIIKKSREDLSLSGLRHVNITLFPEYSIPYKNFNEIENCILEEFKNNSIYVLCLDHIYIENFIELLSNSNNNNKEEIISQIKRDSDFNYIKHRKLVNCCVIYIKDQHGNTKKFIQSKTKPAMLEESIDLKSLYQGDYLLLFDTGEFSFITLICFDIIFESKEGSTIDEILDYIQNIYKKDIDFIIVLQCNPKPEHETIISALNNYYSARRRTIITTNSCFIFLNSSNNTVLPMMSKNLKSFGRSFILFNKQQNAEKFEEISIEEFNHYYRILIEKREDRILIFKMKPIRFLTNRPSEFRKPLTDSRIYDNNLNPIPNLKRIEKEDVFYNRLLKSYHNWKSKEFNDEKETNWPYIIDEKTFVNNFDFLYGSIQSRSNSSNNANCISFLNENILSKPIICLGYYGMGKTTITKMAFINWPYFDSNIFPIYLNLTQENLINYYGDMELIKIIIKEISYRNPDSRSLKQWEKIYDKNDQMDIEENLKDLLSQHKIVLILDGIDETFNNNISLTNFLNFILGEKLLFLITCRLEYRPFFDIFHGLKNELKNILCLELLEWEEEQWDQYIINLKKEYPKKLNLIEDFQIKLFKNVYSNLPRRPLFLKMLSDLEINNDTIITLNQELSNNLAEIYFKFIQWKIIDDYDRKGGRRYNFDKEQYAKECLILLREIAYLEYKFDLEENYIHINLKKIKDICRQKHFNNLLNKNVQEILLRSSFFSILRRTDDLRFVFSHKSFMEYLIAFGTAKSLFPDSNLPEDAHCNKMWLLYQTHEVNQHFINEIDRIQITKKYSIDKRNQFIIKAFKTVIDNNKGNMDQFNERVQLALYYTGYFKLDSRDIVEILKKIIDHKDQYDPIYYRTSSIALSMVLDPVYCEDYVLYLLKNYKSSKHDFNLNNKTQLKYYGQTTLRKILKSDIDQYNNKMKESSIISLKVLTYFTADKIEKHEISDFYKYLDFIEIAADRQKHTKIKEICEIIKGILNEFIKE